MNFTADYCIAYKALRTGVESSRFDRHFGLDSDMEYIKSRIELNAMRPVNRLKAILFAFRVASEMRRQRVLVRGLFDIKEESSVKVVHHKDITLFPITLNRTTVQMVEREDVK